MKTGEYNQKENQQRHNAGKACQIKSSQADLRELPPAPQRRRSNQEAGNREKDLDTGLPVPHKGADELARQAGGIWNFRNEQAYVDVIHQHKKDWTPDCPFHTKAPTNWRGKPAAY